jgi:hypothetical protein
VDDDSYTLFSAAAILWTGFDMPVIAMALVCTVMSLATLEAVAGFCLGCVIYGFLARAGLVGKDDCPTCVGGQIN